MGQLRPRAHQEFLKHALSGIPPERIRYHVCFGSWHLPHTVDAPGVITHHIITVEHPQIVRFMRIVGRENVIAASDYGFARQETIRRVHPRVMWAKFEALAVGACLATAELWAGGRLTPAQAALPISRALPYCVFP